MKKEGGEQLTTVRQSKPTAEDEEHRTFEVALQLGQIVLQRRNDMLGLDLAEQWRAFLIQ